MGMLRRADIQDVAREALVMNLADMAREGQELIASARREADRIIAEAREDREKLISDASAVGHGEGYERGFEAGKGDGERAGREQASELHANALKAIEEGWTRALSDFEEQREVSLAALRRDALQLAITITERVIKRAVTHDSELAIRQMESILGVLSRPTRLVVTIHPEDEAILHELLPEFIQRYAEATHIELVTDGTLVRGSCIARTDAGATIDASINTQFDRLAATVLPGGTEAVTTEQSEREEVAATETAEEAESDSATPSQPGRASRSAA